MRPAIYASPSDGAAHERDARGEEATTAPEEVRPLPYALPSQAEQEAGTTILTPGVSLALREGTRVARRRPQVDPIEQQHQLLDDPCRAHPKHPKRCWFGREETPLFAKSIERHALRNKSVSARA